MASKQEVRIYTNPWTSKPFPDRASARSAEMDVYRWQLNFAKLPKHHQHLLSSQTQKFSRALKCIHSNNFFILSVVRTRNTSAHWMMCKTWQLLVLLSKFQTLSAFALHGNNWRLALKYKKGNFEVPDWFLLTSSCTKPTSNGTICSECVCCTIKGVQDIVV